jgi:Tfp pilus assembly protein PilF/2-polyprenyl-3-methyl-5-hydroxy-6-metoxy-1,4-benzoquinol methylase
MTLTPQMAHLFEEAQDLHQAGRLADAKARYERVLAADPRHGGALHMVGLMAHQVGQNDVAVDLLARAAKYDPGSAALHSNLGLALRGLGRTAEAAASFRRALGLKPDSAEAHSNLGNALLEQGQVDAATDSFRRAVELNPNLAAAQANLGDAYWARGRLADAQACHERALALAPGDADTLKSLAMLALAQGDAARAMQYVQAALARDDSPRSHRIFADIIQNVRWHEDDPAARELLMRAITNGWSRPSVFMSAALGLIKQRQAAGGDLQDDALLMTLLRVSPNGDIALEQALAAARRQILLGGGAGDDFAVTLALQCFLNEYIWPVGDDEAAAVARLVADASARNEAQLVTLACYLPLGELPDAAALKPATPALALLLAQQRDEPAQEKRLGAAVAQLTPISDDVSQAVQAQYEANPYPRWTRLPETIAPAKLGVFLASRHPFAADALKSLPEKPDLLVAGCGTGQSTLELARGFHWGAITSVDLSRASLGHAARKADELGVSGIAFGQADLLNIAALGKRFDVIECSGVLHHMADPFAGWRALLSVLKPGGLMQVALYSATPRAAIARTRAFVAEQGFAGTREGIRACRAMLVRDDRLDMLGPYLNTLDFFSTSDCRDLIFHVQEHTLTLEQIAGFLAQNRLRFIGMEVNEPVRAAYRARFPDDPACVNLSNWAAFEQDNPDTFVSMYRFWIQKP